MNCVVDRAIHGKLRYVSESVVVILKSHVFPSTSYFTPARNSKPTVVSYRDEVWLSSQNDPRKHTKPKLVLFVRFRVISWIVPVPERAKHESRSRHDEPDKK